jgi:lipoyl(octanoyl) transferase
MNVERMGRVAYGPMVALQEARHAAVVAGNAAETLFLLEHDAVVTLGKNATSQHLLLSAPELASRGIELHRSTRGGDVTYHGPGQLVGYPILRLGEGEQDVKRYAWRLEEIVIRTVADFGVQAERRDGMRGIWVGNEKIGAIGVRIANWVTMHGFALNVSTDMSAFTYIVPCGLVGFGVTSLERLCGRAPALAAVADRLVSHAEEVLERRAREVPPSALPAGCAATASAGGPP